MVTHAKDKENSISVNFWGVRGSRSCCGADFMEFGGSTSCISLEHKGTHYIFDAGSGIVSLGKKFKSMKKAHLFLSHAHYDHVNGMSFFDPLWNPNLTLDIYAGVLAPYGGTEAFFKKYLFSHPLFPVKPSDIRAHLTYHNFTPPASLTLEDAELKTIYLNHPGKASGYALYIGGRKFCYILDTETSGESFIDAICDFVKDADICVYDSTFIDAEKEEYKGWGHSTWQDAVSIAARANVTRLFLTHHAPFRTDQELRHIENEARKIFPNTHAAREGEQVLL
ncbi:MAG: MBL fold metallo-hydrolase [Rickettsiales bacterium]|nr:MAG: MBL fold metallo-hydrolase [Rickettsiales bacterium]